MTDKLFKLGVVGFSPPTEFDKRQALKMLIQGYDEFLKHNDLNRNDKIAIVSGYSNAGIPALAYRLGKRRGYHLIGFSAQQILNYDLYPVDEKIIKGKKFGNESPYFLRYIDGLLKVGGGKQSANEFRIFEQAFPNKWAKAFPLQAIK